MPAAASATDDEPPIQVQEDLDTHVYILGGVDPFNWAGMSGLADQIRSYRYPNTRFAGWRQAARFEREIRCLHCQCPGSRFVLIGYSAGSYAVRGMANRLVRDGVPVALVGYVGGDYLRDTEETRLLGVARVVNVTGDGFLLTGRNLFFNGTTVSGAINIHLPGTRHFGLPRQSETVGTLLDEIDAVTATAGDPDRPSSLEVSNTPR
jgi:hypothetical protein